MYRARTVTYVESASSYNQMYTWREKDKPSTLGLHVYLPRMYIVPIQALCERACLMHPGHIGAGALKICKSLRQSFLIA